MDWAHHPLLRRPLHLPRRRDAAAALELDDIQGNLLRGYTYRCATYVFVHVENAAGGRRFLASLVDHVASATPWTGPAPESTLNIAFTYEGLKALGVDAARLASFPDEFREGMAARAKILGDIGRSDPAQWEAGLGTGEAHILVTVYAESEDVFARRRADLIAKFGTFEGDVHVVHEQVSHTLPGGRDNFGFVDGIAQPAVAQGGVTPRPGDGAPEHGNRWRAMAAGEFVLGYLDEDRTMPRAPAAPFDRNCTFSVYRKIAMHTATFRDYTETAAREHGVTAEFLAAKMVGRWRDGTPVSVSPDKPDPTVASNAARVNDFRFADDANGFRCPAGAHVRRVNPRDHAGFFDGKLTNRHRIIRRGRPYGTVLPAGAENDGQERGLIFECYNASIERQFEVIQNLWVNDGDPFACGIERDPLIGYHRERGGRLVVSGEDPIILSSIPNFTTIRGGEYCFRPSMSALRWLAEPLASASPKDDETVPADR